VGGLPPSGYRRRHGMGYLPETIAFPSGWTGEALLREGARLLSGRAGNPRELVEEAVQTTGLSRASLRVPLDTLSKGMARRVALALALQGRPDFLLLDEPLTGLDAPSRARLRGVILDAARLGASVVLASHDLDEVERVADRALLLVGGRVAASLGGTEITARELEARIVAAEGSG